MREPFLASNIPLFELVLTCIIFDYDLFQGIRMKITIFMLNLIKDTDSLLGNPGIHLVNFYVVFRDLIHGETDKKGATNPCDENKIIRLRF